jgi:hypothetical protein
MIAQHFLSRNFIFYLLIGALICQIGWSQWQAHSIKASWQDRIVRYERISDSLQHEMLSLEAAVRTKDRLLVDYLSSLDESIRILDHSRTKNKMLLQENQRKRDSITSVFCEELRVIGSTSEICK